MSDQWQPPSSPPPQYDPFGAPLPPGGPVPPQPPAAGGGGSRAGLILAIAALGALGIAVLGGVLVFAAGGDDDGRELSFAASEAAEPSTESTPVEQAPDGDPASRDTPPVGATDEVGASDEGAAPIPVAPDEPIDGPVDDGSFTGFESGFTYGDNPRLDELWDNCAAGVYADCDTLYFTSDFDTDYEAFGDSCGRRNEPAGLCTDIHGDGGYDSGFTYGDNPRLDELWDGCAAGVYADCDTLYFTSDFDTDYEAFGDSCGRRNEPAGLCTDIYGG